MDFYVFIASIVCRRNHPFGTYLQWKKKDEIKLEGKYLAQLLTMKSRLVDWGLIGLVVINFLKREKD